MGVALEVAYTSFPMVTLVSVGISYAKGFL